ncbi:MAG: hypothetical protein KDE09_25405, partial [Anaerolineales bacterium]|nr:hypothetical protein [Anaerolineales bacterium]
MKVNEVVVSRLKIEHLRETLGVGVPSPRLSWQVITEAQNWQQVAYEIIRPGRNGPMHDSYGRIESRQSRFAPWPFEPLVSRLRISLKVRVWGNDG